MSRLSRTPFRHWANLSPFLPRRSGVRMGLVAVTSFFGSLCESGILVLITLTADALIRQKDTIEAGPLSLGRQQAVLLAAGLVVVRVLLTTGSAFVAGRFCALTMRNAQDRLAASYLASSHPVRGARQVGDVAAMLVNHGRFTGDLANGLTLVAASVCALLAFGGTSLAVNPWATLGIALIGGALVLALRPLRRMSQRAAEEFASTARTLSTSMTEVETIHREVDVFDVREPVRAQLERTITSSASRFRRLRFLAAAVPQFFQAAMLGAAVLSLLLVVNNPGAADLASIGAVVLLLVRSMSAAQQLVMANQRVLEFGAYAAELNLQIGEFLAAAPRHGDERPDSLSPVRMSSITFSYDGSTTVLAGMDTELRTGELVGLVGPSGAGKSTLVELLLRLREPTEGELTFGGRPGAGLADDWFATRVALVPQHANLITGTVAENVAFFRDVDDDMVREALRRAHLDREIAELPDGIHTRLGADDRALSGGQRQRLTIARALAGDPELVILDEPTSALDAISEEAIAATLAEMREGRIVVIIAHRYSTLRQCSRILVLRNGCLEVDATPDLVAERSDFFRTMIGEGAA